MDFNYYSFVLNGEERIYYTYISNDTELEILEWAERFGFVRLEDFDKCTNMRQLPQEEVDRRNKELYSIWWEEHKNDNPAFSRGFPPTIGEVQLN